MSVHDAQPGDIYTDEHGQVWAVIAICPEPTVQAERIWPTTLNARPNRQGGGVSGFMWKGWKRIARTMEIKP